MCTCVRVPVGPTKVLRAYHDGLLVVAVCVLVVALVLTRSRYQHSWGLFPNQPQQIDGAIDHG